jgi:hypothetical protein
VSRCGTATSSTQTSGDCECSPVVALSAALFGTSVNSQLFLLRPCVQYADHENLGLDGRHIGAQRALGVRSARRAGEQQLMWSFVCMGWKPVVADACWLFLLQSGATLAGARKFHASVSARLLCIVPAAIVDASTWWLFVIAQVMDGNDMMWIFSGQTYHSSVGGEQR